MQMEACLWGGELSPVSCVFHFPAQESLSQLHCRQTCPRPPAPIQLERKLHFHNMIKHCQLTLQLPANLSSLSCSYNYTEEY